jgi:hypothetical protein
MFQIMLTNDDMYRLKYVLDSSHIKTVNISKPEINSILDNIDFMVVNLLPMMLSYIILYCK